MQSCAVLIRTGRVDGKAMGVGVLVIGSEDVPRAILQTTTTILGRSPLQIGVISVPKDCDRDALKREISTEIERLDEGDGVLLVVDMFGSTLSNLARTFVDKERIMMVAGLNVPMLVRVMNYPKLSLWQLRDKAVTGGRDGVFACDRDYDC